MIGYESVIKALKARVEERLPSRLDAITGEFGDSIPLPVPAAYRLSARSDEPDYPVVMFLAGPAESREQPGGWLTSARQINVIIEHREEDDERLSLALLRYERALLESALSVQAPAPAHGIKWLRTQPGPVFELDGLDGRQWQSWMQLTFELLTYEEGR